LAKTEAGGTAVTSARGKLDFEWSDVCDGWAIRQRTRIFVTHADGSEVDFGWSLNTWESKDGLGPVEIQDSLLGLFVIQARDGTLCADRRPMGED